MNRTTTIAATVLGLTVLAIAPASAAVISGTNQADSLVGTASADRINAFGGADVVHARAGGDKVRGGGGEDELWGGAGVDTIIDGTGNDVVHSGPRGDRVGDRQGTDVFYLEGGNDTIWMDARQSPNDHVVCGPGDDTVIYPYPAFEHVDPTDTFRGCEFVGVLD